MNVRPLEGKVAIVTGASRGIGKQLAEDLAAHEAKVVVNYANSATNAEETASGIRERGGEAIALKADVSQIPEVEGLFRETLETFGRVDILINNAGVMHTKPILQITEEDFDQHFDLNVKGTYFAIQQAAIHMKEKGVIINFSTSMLGAMVPAYSLYAGTKGAVEQFTRHLARELGSRGIRINAVAPGPVNTELFRAGKTEEQIKAVGSGNAFGRIGETEDISKVVLFLCGEESGWITGQTIRVNGGFT